MNTKNPQRRYWPYDEVSVSADSNKPGRFNISTPWLSLSVNVEPKDLARALKISDKMKAGEIGLQDADDLHWFFKSLDKYSFAYILPRSSAFGSDTHELSNLPTDCESPKTMLLSTIDGISELSYVKNFSEGIVGKTPWTWDVEAALEFSKVPDGHDPESLFSIARRFHLLNDIEWNKTADLLEFVRSLRSEIENFRYASAVVARQNHYVTQLCDEVLKTALPLSQSAHFEVSEFIQAEVGHDKILTKAIQSLGYEPDQLPLENSVVCLMELFRASAARNLLAFAMVTDIFERTSYRAEDPFASVLKEGGHSYAAKQFDVHRDINDAGEHENVALEFLNFMKPVNTAYAAEALRFAELATLVIHQLSAETLERLKTRKTMSSL
jgi:hypothetical protein